VGPITFLIGEFTAPALAVEIAETGKRLCAHNHASSGEAFLCEEGHAAAHIAEGSAPCNGHCAVSIARRTVADQATSIARAMVDR
jgi:hypothetical protein